MENPPDTIAEYKILAELGRGTTGIVYKAWHPRFNRTVALKLMHTTPEADRILRAVRFGREARAMASLRDDHIPALYELGEHGKTPFYIRELVDGRTLDQAVKDGSIDFRKGLAILATIARTVGRVHERGLIHRSLQPANVLVAEDGAVKLIGFGRARAVDDAMNLSGDQVEGTEVDVNALKQMLNWLCSALGQSVPPRLADFRSDGSVSAARAFAESLEGCLT